MNTLEVKICGQTVPAEAAACAAAGADAVGVIFFPASPRHLSPERARAIVEALPPDFPVVGVFVDESPDAILRTAEAAGLTRVQLHGRETLETVRTLLENGLRVIRALKKPGAALVREADLLPAGCGLLVECGKGPLPGGNGAAWNWEEARPLGDRRAFALAGGLTPDNAAAAALAAHPSALDVSSGVESEPGRKDLEKTRRLIRAARDIRITWPVAPVFLEPRPKGAPPCPVNR